MANCIDTCMSYLDESYQYACRNKLVTAIVSGVVICVLVLFCYFAFHNNSFKGSDVLEESKIIDFQNYMSSNIDEFVKKSKNDSSKRSSIFKQLEKGKIGAQVWTVTSDCQKSLETTLNGIETVKAILKDEKVTVAESSKDIENFDKKGKIAHMLSVEGVEPIGEYLTVLDTYKEMGVRSVSLRTEKCDNSAWSSSPKLDSFVEKMNQLGLIIDLAWSPVEVIEKVLNISKAPIVISHMSKERLSSINGTLKHLKEKNGLLLIPLHSDENGSLQKLMDVLKAIHTNMGGCDNIGLASGFEGHNKYNETLNDASKMPLLFDALYENDKTVWTPQCLKQFARDNLFQLMKSVKVVSQ